MCRRNQLWGVAAMAFGLGLLIGGHISGFWCSCIAIVVIGTGFTVMQKK